MKVIKVGKIKQKTWKVKCPQCNSILKYIENDIFSDKDGEFIICPMCGQYIEHKD